VVHLSGPEDDHPGWEAAMKFRLTYEGPLRSTNRDARPGDPDYMALHKHEIRQHFHGQLRELWATNKFLMEHTINPKFWAPVGPDEGPKWGWDPSEAISLQMFQAERHRSNGFRFVPLVSDDFHLPCSLEILFLRRDIPGSALHAGDIDNRIKTVIDALRLPRLANEFEGKDRKPIVPMENEDPFFVLLEDDKQVSRFAVETDTLLDPITENPEDAANVRLVITVELRPYHSTLFNLSFA
jgi:hypothetical protein